MAALCQKNVMSLMKSQGKNGLQESYVPLQSYKSHIYESCSSQLFLASASLSHQENRVTQTVLPHT